jgi:hypothetical protein
MLPSPSANGKHIPIFTPFRSSTSISIVTRSNMTEILTVIVKLSGLVFVIGSMLAMGLSLTIPQMVVSVFENQT